MEKTEGNEPQVAGDGESKAAATNGSTDTAQQPEVVDSKPAESEHSQGISDPLLKDIPDSPKPQAADADKEQPSAGESSKEGVDTEKEESGEGTTEQTAVVNVNGEVPVSAGVSSEDSGKAEEDHSTSESTAAPATPAGERDEPEGEASTDQGTAAHTGNTTHSVDNTGEETPRAEDKDSQLQTDSGVSETEPTSEAETSESKSAVVQEESPETNPVSPEPNPVSPEPADSSKTEEKPNTPAENLEDPGKPSDSPKPEQISEDSHKEEPGEESEQLSTLQQASSELVQQSIAKAVEIVTGETFITEPKEADSAAVQPEEGAAETSEKPAESKETVAEYLGTTVTEQAREQSLYRDSSVTSDDSDTDTAPAEKTEPNPTEDSPRPPPAEDSFTTVSEPPTPKTETVGTLEQVPEKSPERSADEDTSSAQDKNPEQEESERAKPEAKTEVSESVQPDTGTEESKAEEESGIQPHEEQAQPEPSQERQGITAAAADSKPESQPQQAGENAAVAETKAKPVHVRFEPSTSKMGAGASRDSEMEEVDVDPQYAARSTTAMSTASGWNAGTPKGSPQRGQKSFHSQQSSKSKMSSGHMSRFIDGYEEAEVRISQDGFSQQEVNIMEGQAVRFVWDQSCPNNATLIQVVYDGDELRPVIGGFQVALDDQPGTFHQQLNLEGEYKFALSGIRCTPLMVHVKRKMDLQAEVTDDGFIPNIIYVDQGTSVKWTWKQTTVPHTVGEVSYIMEKGCLGRQPPNQSIVATTSGSHRQTFNRPGIHYMRTEGSEPGKTHLCIVVVQSVSREYRVEILDRSFQPMILLIEEGDRVWFSWDRFKCKKAHSVYQIEPPTMDHKEDDAYEPVRDGFKWTTPSKQGLMSHRFDKVGVFYFSDQNFEEAAEYIGTIIVKPKQREHIIKLQENGFAPDLIRVTTGDRVWWTWDGQSVADVGEQLLLLEEDKVLNPLSRKNTSAEQSEHLQDLDASGMQVMTKAGAATVHFTTVGVYTYKLSDVGDAFSCCSVLVNPGSKNHTVHLTDNGFEPKVITVNCNDRVWWVWQSGKKQHNIVQVSHQGLPIPGGFCSGQPRDSPSAFAHQFSTPGVYYFISKSLPQVFGAVVVSTRPQVHEVSVKESELRPDPVTIQLNDVVAWVFGGPRQYDVTLVETVDQVLDAGSSKALVPRRCFARGIARTGNLHFKSKSFQKRKETNYMEETRLSSVVCDDRCDSIIVTLDKKGFHPNSVYLQKGQSLLWSWKGTDEEHNIIHVTDPNSATPLNMIKGPRAFNSGRPLPNDSFLYTFDEDGSYTVVSQGAPGFSCTVNVLEVAPRTAEPRISSEQEGGTVDRFTRIRLASDTPGTKIYYTLDGSRPSVNSKCYKPQRGVILRNSGLNFIRAIAVADQHLQSYIFTSKRFWVLSKGDADDVPEESSEEDEMTVPPQTKSWDWWTSKPQIKACFTSPGTMEVFWNPPDQKARKQIRAYQIFLNGVSYCQKFPPSSNSLKLVGLAGGRKYNVALEVYPTNTKNQVIESNTLVMTCPKVAPPGGPVISLETHPDPNTLSVVWMSIASYDSPVDGYLVYLNDQQCGPKLVPEAGSNRCKVVVSGCDTGIDYKLYVLAVLADTDETRMSNVLVIQLPLDTSNIKTPPPSERVADEEVYLEYIEVLEGSGYLPEMDDPKNKTAPQDELVTETETETSTETETETESETETETESEMETQRGKQLKQQGAVSLGSRRQDGLQQAASPAKKVVEVETVGLDTDCTPLPATKPSLRSFTDVYAYNAEQISRSDISDSEQLGAVEDGSKQGRRKRISFRAVAKSVTKFIQSEKSGQEKPGPARGRKKGGNVEQVNWDKLKKFMGDSREAPPGDVGSQPAMRGGLKPALKVRSSDGDRSGSPVAAPRQSSRLRAEDAIQRPGDRFQRSRSDETYDDEEYEPPPRPPGPRHSSRLRAEDALYRRGERFQRSRSDESYDDDDCEPPRRRPQRGMPRSHSDDYEDYEDRRSRDWVPPAGTPRYPRGQRRDSYHDEASDYSEGLPFHQRSLSPDPRRQRSRRGSYHPDFSPERLSQSSVSRRSSDLSRSLPERRNRSDGYLYEAGGPYKPQGHRGHRPYRERGSQIYREGVDSDTASDKDSVEHLYISPRYAERMDDRAPPRKSVQFYFGPAENDEEDFSDRRSRHSQRRPEETRRHLCADRDQVSLDTQLSDGETIVPDSSSRRGSAQYVVHEPYGDVPMYGHERDPTPPPLPAESGGMLSRFLDVVNHVPFIREDLLDSGVEENVDVVPRSTPNYKTASSSASEYKDPSTYRDLPTAGSQNRDSKPKARAEPQTSTPRIGGLVDDDTTTEESETESDYESESDREGPPGGHVVILDAAKNQATDTKENFRQRAVGDKGHYKDDDHDGMAVIGHGGNGRKKVRGKSTALIEVQKTVALDMAERQVKDTGDILEKTKLAVSTEQKSMVQVKEGELVSGDGDGILPAPSIMATTKGKHSVRVAWELPRQPDPQYKLLLFVVNVVGTKFSSEINSDISYECNLVEKGKQVRGVQHCWNINTDRQQCVIKGLQPGLTYRIYVIANYSTVHGNKPCEIQTTSSVLYYTTMGPPKAPRLRLVRVDLYQACIVWDAPALHENARLSGYQITVDGKPLGGLRNPDIQQMVINNLVPGKTISINVVAVMARAAQESAPSKTIHITCPRRPAAPTISQQPSYKKGCVLLAWDKPRGHPDTTEESITGYSIYVDGQWHGEVKANKMGDQQGYQFFLTDLAPEQSYDVSVKSIAGDRTVDPDAQHVHCLCESFMSNLVPVMAPAAPKSPKLRLEGLHPDGIDVTWQTPQQSGDAHISGYQMLKNGKLYGSIIPPDVNSLRIRDVSLGEKLTLQLIALTEHPVGKSDIRASSATGDKDSGISGSTMQRDEGSADIFASDRYSGCKPGPKLVIHYTGLVCPPSEVWCERVTGHSALIVWSKGEEKKAHFLTPDSYQVTWWPGDRPQDEINSDSTTDDHLLITNLRPATTYSVVVEARKMEKYTDMDEGVSYTETPDGLNAFILSSKSDHLTVRTASPPDPPRNVGITATTCNSLNIAWDPPQEHGSEVIAVRIECISLNAQDPHHVTEDIMPDSTSADITGLHEKTDYLIRVIAVTEEYFDRLPDKHKHKKLHAIPRDVLVAQEESPWLPSANIIAKTAGTEAPANIRLTESTMTSLTVTWTPPLVYGSNKLLSQIVRWRDIRRTKPSDPEDLIVASHVNLLPTEDTLTISDLVPGSQYQIVIEAVVSIKTSLNPDQWDSGIEKYRRTAHVMSKPLVAWTRAPIEPPKVLVASYDQSSANLYWEKPILMSIIGKDDEGNPRYLRRYLEGYRLEINGKLQSCLGPAAQTCTLTKCKPGKQYSVVLVAMTCTEDRRRERKEKFKGYFKTTAPQETDYVGLLEDDLLDQAPSDPVEVTLPKPQDGFIETMQARFIHQEERDNRTFGDVEVTWTIQGQSNLLKQFSVIWFSSEDRVIQTKYVGPEKRRCTIPVTHLKSIYNITVEPCYYTEVLPQQPQDIQIMIPGPPDAPEIFLRSQDKDEFVIEWGEPRCYGGVKVKGYQVFMNDKKIGNELSNSHRKAVIPCRMSKAYRINLVALSSTPDFPDSPKSNTLLINSGKQAQGSLSVEEFSTDDHDLPVKVTGVTETGIHLDWSAFVENHDVAYYKIQWSSVAQPAQREVRLSPKDVSCVINKCLPGTTHFVRLVAYSDDGQILEKSKQLTVQTSAPPDAPVLSVRACNFRYIAIQWEKPTTYGDALITGYKVYVNGIVEAVLSPDSLSYTFTQGKWCQEYSFQVQAITAGDELNSKPSEPLVLTWPGVRAPHIRKIPSVSSSALRVAWDAPYLTDGVKVKHYRLCCVEEDTEKLVQSIGPIHPDTCEAEFKNLNKGGYVVFLETHLYGTGEVVRSEGIRMQPSVCPDPPQISVTVVGLDERRQLEKLTCELANKRDRLIRAVGHKLKRIGALAHPLRAEKDEDVVMGAHTLTGVEELLEGCFAALENYTGQLIAHVSWQCPQSNEDVHLSGFKVLVDGKQYGSSMHSGVRSVRLQLSLDQPSYRLSMVSLSDKPAGCSVESSEVELLTAPFKAFSYYCYHNIHSKNARWPAQGCCKYQDSMTYERQVGKKLANQGLLTKHVPPPACSLLDIFAGDYKPLMTGHRPQHPTVLLFWTPWCLSSQKTMDYYVRFAREASKEFNFIAVSCGVSGVKSDERQALVHEFTSNGWREDGVMWHCTSECASNIYRTLSTINHTTTSLRVEPDMVSEKYMDLTELLGIAGVPTFLFIHPEGYIAWHGRYSSFDYAAFCAFMRHTNSEVMRHPCPVFNCDCCKNDMTIDQEVISALLPEKVRTQAQAHAVKSHSDSETNLNSVAGSRPDLKYAAINGFTENAAGTEKLFMARKQSPKRRTKLSISRRPFSASAAPTQLQSSPYLAKVVPHSSPSRSRNRPVSAKLVHYV